MTDVQLASDLHLEFLSLGDAPDFESALDQVLVPAADVLLLAGDVAPAGHKRLGPFLRWTASRFRRVLYVPGNHEYYGCTPITALRVLSERVFAAGNNVTLLDRDRVSVDEHWDLLGATLWSHIPVEHWRQLAGFSDFVRIKSFGPVDYARKHGADVEWLRAELGKDDDRRKLVLTHHPPSTKGTSDPAYESIPGRVVNSAFGTDLPELVEKADAWLYGHTHWARTEWPYFSNPRGYHKLVGPPEVPNYSPSYVVRLPADRNIAPFRLPDGERQ